MSLILPAQRQRIHHMAYHDPLTGLPNRALMQDRLRHAINLAQRDLVQVAVMFLDLDRFKVVNDTLGHEVGDLLLKNVAERMQASLRQTDTVARLGGDEFVIIMECIAELACCRDIANSIIQRISAPFNIQGHDIHVGTSIGIALYPQDGTDAYSLVKHADMAMYVAKNAGKGTYRFYCAGMSDTVTPASSCAIETTAEYTSPV